MRFISLWLLCAVVGCSSSPEPVSIRLSELFDARRVQNPQPPRPVSPFSWRFQDDERNFGWSSLHDVHRLRVDNGMLTGRTGKLPLIVAATPDTLDRGGVHFARELDAEFIIEYTNSYAHMPWQVALVPGDEIQTYTLTSASLFRTVRSAR